MVFLAVTAEWGHPGSAVETSAPAQADLARVSAPKKAEPVPQPPIALPTAAISGASDQADIDDTASINEPQDTEPEAAIEAPSPPADSAAEAATEGTPLNAETADADPDETRPDPVPGNDTSLHISMSEGDVHEDASPQAAIAEPSEPVSPVAASTTNASVEKGTSKTASVEQPAPAAAAPQAASKVAQPKGAIAGSTSKAGVENGTSKTVSAEPAAVKVTTPSATPKAGLDRPRLKQAARPTPPQEEVPQPRSPSPWRPMALAPADKPSTSLTQAPTSRPSGGNYGAQVWSALARHKPKAGESGSTTVIFAIGDAGALRFVRVGHSSGNARLDQLALATVRNAAPYPAPPGGTQSFTIRIDFH
jgi:periplasmic protein TonB